MNYRLSQLELNNEIIEIEWYFSKIDNNYYYKSIYNKTKFEYWDQEGNLAENGIINLTIYRPTRYITINLLEQTITEVNND